jgi:hypothetical protein
MALLQPTIKPKSLPTSPCLSQFSFKPISSQTCNHQGHHRSSSTSASQSPFQPTSSPAHPLKPAHGDPKTKSIHHFTVASSHHHHQFH